MANKNQRATLRPSKAYSHCPSCKTTDLIRMDVDVLCGKCDWDSTAAFVDSGGMDNIFAAYRDHFMVPHQNSAPFKKKLMPVPSIQVAKISEVVIEDESPSEFFNTEASA